MHISTKGISAFAEQTKIPAKEFKLKHSFHPENNLIKYHHLGNLLIKVLNSYLGRDGGRPSACVTEIRE